VERNSKMKFEEKSIMFFDDRDRRCIETVDVGQF
jgi:hypothetical protein